MSPKPLATHLRRVVAMDVPRPPGRAPRRLKRLTLGPEQGAARRSRVAGVQHVAAHARDQARPMAAVPFGSEGVSVQCNLLRAGLSARGRIFALGAVSMDTSAPPNPHEDSLSAVARGVQ